MTRPGSPRRPGSGSRPPDRSRRPAVRRAGRALPTPGAGGGPGGWRTRLGAARTNTRALKALVLVVLAGFLAILLGPTLSAYVGQRAELAALKEEVAGQQQRVKELQKEQARWQDPAYVEQQARQRLKFVKPGERSYTVLDAETGEEDATAGVPGVTGHRERPTGPWYATVWQSARVADVPSSKRP